MPSKLGGTVDGRRRTPDRRSPRRALAVLCVALAAVGFAQVGAASTPRDPVPVAAPPAQPPAALQPAAPPPAATRPLAALWFGDSYTIGDGGGGPTGSGSCFASELMGWTCLVDAQGGTGFVNDGRRWRPYFQRLGDRLPAAVQRWGWVDIVVVDAGRNDNVKLPGTRETVTATLKQVRTLWPKATIIVIVPWSTFNTYLSPLTFQLRREAAAIGAYLADPYSRGWVKVFWDGHMHQNLHPTLDGYRYVGRNLAAEFTDLGLRDLPLPPAFAGSVPPQGPASNPG